MVLQSGTMMRSAQGLITIGELYYSCQEEAAMLVIFRRVINVETGEVESVAQVILPKDRDVNKLLM